MVGFTLLLVIAVEPRVPQKMDAQDYCRTCLHLANDMQTKLLPELASALKRRDAARGRYEKSATVGELDEIIDRHLENGCLTMDIASSPAKRKACKHMLGESFDELNDFFAKWATGSRQQSEWRAALCTKLLRACRTSDLNLLPQPGKGEVRTELRTQRPPDQNDKPVFVAVGETLNGTMNDRTDHDLLIYFQHDDERHERLGPMIERLGDMLWALPRRPPTFSIARIDAVRNELYAPWNGLTSSSVLCFNAGRPVILPNTPDLISNAVSVLEWLEPVEVRLDQVLTALADCFQHVKSKQHIGNLRYDLSTTLAIRVPFWADERAGVVES